VREVPVARMAHVELSQLPGPKNWAMAGGSNGYRAALVRRQLTPGLISSLPRWPDWVVYLFFDKLP
jgi:hypothetical protein